MTEVREKRKDLLVASGRITPREVLEAYEETGLEPCDGWGDGKKTGCGLAAVVGGATMSAGAAGVEMTMAASNLLLKRMPCLDGIDRSEYKTGFMRGFDNDRLHPFRDLVFRKGHRDGKRARTFVKARLGA